MNKKTAKCLDFDFRRHLEHSIKDYNGKYSETLLMTPDIYYLCTSMIYSKKITTKERTMLYKAVAYFILPRDVYSESIHGVKGFIDDVMLCLYVLNLIAKRHIDHLKDNWTLSPSQLDKLLNEDFDQIRRENKKMFEQVLKEVGIDSD